MTSAGASIAIVLTLVDQAEAALKNARQNLGDWGKAAETAGNQAKPAAESASAFGVSLDGAGKAAQQAGQALLGFGGEALSPLQGLFSQTAVAAGELASGGALLGVAAAAGAAAAALEVLGARAAAHLTQLQQIAGTTGLSIEATHKLATEFEAAGGSANSLIRFGSTLTETMSQYADALEKGNAPSEAARAITEQLGIALVGTDGHLRDQGQVLTEVIDKLGNFTNKQEAARIAIEIFGRRGVGELIPLLQNYGELSAFAAGEQAKFGDSLDPQKAIQYNMQMTALRDDIDVLALKVLPIATAAVAALNTVLDKARIPFAGLRVVLESIPGFGTALQVADLALSQISTTNANAASSATDAGNAFEGEGRQINTAVDPAKEFNNALQTAQHTLGEFKNLPTPELLSLQADLADVNAEIADLQPAYDAATASIKRQKDAIDEETRSQDKLIQSLRDELDALDAKASAQERSAANSKADADYLSKRASLEAQLRGANADPELQRSLNAQRTALIHQHDAELQKRQAEDEKAQIQARIKGAEDERKALEDRAKALKNPLEEEMQTLRDRAGLINDHIKQLDTVREKHIAEGLAIDAVRLKAQGLLGDEDDLLKKIDDMVAGWGNVKEAIQPSADAIHAILQDLAGAGFGGGSTGGFFGPPTPPASPRVGVGAFGPGGTNQISQAEIDLLNRSVGRASGGPVYAGEPYIVGESGWEWFVPNQNGRIVSQSQITNSNRRLQNFGPITINLGTQRPTHDALDYALRSL